MESSGWFGVRCIFRVAAASTGIRTYEERVTVWRAADPDAAIGMAEAEAREYAEAIDADYLELAQVYVMADSLGDGAEVFSLVRDSSLNTAEYLAAFFDTGSEHQTSADPETA
jgi:hypothetical protein